MSTPRLGQHFLQSRSVIEHLLTAAPLEKEDTVLEIGPGKGILTEELLNRAARVVAVEKDQQLYEFLADRFADQLDSRLCLLSEDIRSLSPDKPPLKELIVADHSLQKVGNENHSRYRVIANIPYYLTGRLIRSLLTAGNQPQSMVLLIQKEVAERIVGPENSLLSLSVRVYGTPRLIKKVPAGCFSPPPKVDSAILAVTDINRTNFSEYSVSEELFFRLLKAGLVHRRKYLRSNLIKNLSLDSHLVDEALVHIAVGKKSRPEELSLKQWLELAALLGSHTTEN